MSADHGKTSIINTPDFEGLYRRDADPWRVGDSAYEQRKLDLVVAALARRHYAFAWDAACGTGHLALRLADRADRVLATDLAAAAVEIAATTCAGRPNVEVRVQSLPEPAGEGPAPDLVLLSEVFYYLSDPDRAATTVMVDATAASRAEVVAVHWRHVPDDAWLSGAAAQKEIVARLCHAGWTRRLHLRDTDFVLDTLVRGDGSR